MQLLPSLTSSRLKTECGTLGSCTKPKVFSRFLEERTFHVSADGTSHPPNRPLLEVASSALLYTQFILQICLVLFKSYLLDVCYYPQNKVNDLVIVANGQACSLLIDGHNSSDLQLANCGCAACKHWQRPSCIYQSICSQLYLCW